MYNCENILKLYTYVIYMSHVVKYVQDYFYLIRLNLIEYLVQHESRENFLRKRIFYHKIHFKYECSSVRVRARCVCASRSYYIFMCYMPTRSVLCRIYNKFVKYLCNKSFKYSSIYVPWGNGKCLSHIYTLFLDETGSKQGLNISRTSPSERVN